MKRIAFSKMVELTMRQKGIVLLPIILIIATVVVVGYCVYKNKKLDNTNPAIKITPSQQYIQNVTKVAEPTISLPNFLDFPIISRHQFDTSNWNIYENKEIGFNFKYPNEWGEPIDYLKRIEYHPDECKDKNGCLEYRLKFSKGLFSNNDFVYSNTKNYTPGRSGLIEHIFWLYHENDFCSGPFSDFKYNTIHCQTVGDITDATLYDNCFGQSSYRRIHIIKLKGKLLPGLTFGGDFGLVKFIEDNYSYGEFYLQNDNSPIIQYLNEALLNRRLPEEVIHNFDLLEKIFETIVIF